MFNYEKHSVLINMLEIENSTLNETLITKCSSSLCYSSKITMSEHVKCRALILHKTSLFIVDIIISKRDEKKHSARPLKVLRSKLVCKMGKKHSHTSNENAKWVDIVYLHIFIVDCISGGSSGSGNSCITMCCRIQLFAYYQNPYANG